MCDFNKYKIGERGPLDKKIKDIIFRTYNAIVYLDEDNVIQWSFLGELDSKLGEIQNDVSYWESICNRVFNNKNSYEYKTLLAESYARILDDGDYSSAKEIINKTKSRIEKQGKEVLKQNYILSSLFFSLFIILLLIVFVFSRQYFENCISISKYEIIISSLFGGIGVFIFTMIKLRNYEPEIVVSKQIHRLDGLLRIFYGLIAGLVIAICVKSNLILGLVQDVRSIFVYAFLGTVAGASEVLIPNLIKQIEGRT